jgi:hypothetical protein
MSKYKLLWIDDKWEEMDFKDICEQSRNGFQIVCCTNAEEGMTTFETYLEEWSGVIMDAKILMTPQSQDDKFKGMNYCIKRINELRSKREVPYYIFTGHQGLDSSSIFAEEHEDHYYEKFKDEDRLISDIKRRADAMLETQIIHKHIVVFETWKESHIDLLRILTALEKEEWKNNSLLNDIRKMMDVVMKRLYERGLCTVEHNGSNLSECSKMIGDNAMTEFIPIYIQRAIHMCVNVTNEGSHYGTRTDRDVRANRAPYLIRSLIYNMLSILYWCKDLPTKEEREWTLIRVEQAKEQYARSLCNRFCQRNHPISYEPNRTRKVSSSF